MGLDGYILTAFILGIPANEIVLPIILMCYLKGGTLVNIEDTIQIGQILIQNGWTMITAMNVMLFTILLFLVLQHCLRKKGNWQLEVDCNFFWQFQLFVELFCACLQIWYIILF